MTILQPIAHSIFRAYDVRGVYADTLTEHSVRLIGQAIGSQLRDMGEQQVVLGRDGRLSSPSLAQAAAEGLLQAGCHVIDLGMLPTPVLYYAVQSGLAPHGVMITGSHNPPDQNGIKIVINGQSLYNEHIQHLYERIIRGELWHQPSASNLQQTSILPAYQQVFCAQVHLQRRLRIGLDCGNGATALLGAALFRDIGCEVHPLYCEVDGTFPNHSPDPTQPANLHALQALVREKHLDIGIAFDGDGDRMIAVDGNGHILWPDRILQLLAQAVLTEQPGRVVAYDVKCTYRLDHTIRAAGGVPAMCISGHSLLKKFIREHDAVLGGEFSGHIVLRDRGMESDDGMYIAARLLETLSTESASPAKVFARIAEGFSTQEFKQCFESYEAAHAAVEFWKQHQQLQASRIITLDGIRAEYPDGWGLARASNTCPCITLRFEADTQERLEAIRNLFRADIQRLQLTAEALTF
ncbi:MAG: phosphomannomutase/phosphoglucomutase [Gammaproteobacteria bacterium]|nr:phosphomannomutase/phosphoglucomutase [Gammaproteobacteria bacterium]MBU1723214.1 phosphomannomutase/phosphoglucomutase [Gammaproteobacteria bacterium]MBU2007239.1 phosphomannomutase/phosphoglucomutase [Gammaproteobacteria bacterium]